MTGSKMPVQEWGGGAILQPEHLPVLRWDVSITIHGEIAIFARGDAEYKFSGPPGNLIAEVALKMDGYHSPHAIAGELQISSSVVESIISQLMHHDLAVEIDSAVEMLVTPDQFCAVCRRLFPQWKEHLFSHLLWQRLATGQATRAEFIGWLLESYHFIEGVNDRLSLAVAACPQQEVRELFARHYTEEYNHSAFFLKALAILKIDAATARSSQPLPGTRAIMSFMRQCARQDPLRYAVCSGFLESTGEDRIRACNFFTLIGEHYTAGQPEAIRPLIEHVKLDEAFGHNNLMEAVTARLGTLSVKRASEALSAGAMLVETLERWSTDILRNYVGEAFRARCGLEQYRLPLSWPDSTLTVACQ